MSDNPPETIENPPTVKVEVDVTNETPKVEVKNELPTAKEWGPHVWYTIDIFVKGYGEHPDAKLRQAAVRFFYSLTELLPCPECRKHYGMLLKKRPVQKYLMSSVTLGNWVGWIKNEVSNIIKTQNATKMLKDQQPNSKFRDITPIVNTTKPHAKKLPANPRNIRQKNKGPAPNPRKMAPPVQRSIIAAGPAKKQQIKMTQQKSLSYNQKIEAELGKNWKGSKAGLQNFIKTEKFYRRPCACS